MRNVLKLRISKRTIFSSVVDAAIVAGFIGLINLPVPAPVEDMGDMGSFIQEQVELVPLPTEKGDLGAFIESLPKDAVPVIVVPVLGATMREAALSDGKFDGLSPKWKRGAVQVVKGKWCDRVAVTSWSSKTIGSLFQKAQAIVESNCIESAVGADGEVSVVQVMPKTCKEIGIKGNYAKTDVALACAEKYRTLACKEEMKKRGTCSPRVMILAHNYGITGALRTANAASADYVRKVDYVACTLKGKRCT